MKRILLSILLLAFCGSTYAQGVLVIGDPRRDVTKAPFSLVTTDGTSPATANTTSVQSQLTAKNFAYPWFFPPSSTAFAGYEFDKTLRIPAYSGMTWTGGGAVVPIGGTGLTSTGSILQLKASTYRTAFDGSTNKLTSSGAGTTMIVTGRATVAEDQYCSVYVSGGTSATAGWYGIASVTPGASGSGTWTLDRNWCSGAVTNGQGSYCPEMIQDHSVNSTFEGLTFTNRRSPSSESTAYGDVLYHVLTNQQSGGCPTGKQTFNKCSFGFSKVAILHGRYLVGYDAGTQSPILTTWAGYDDDHADHCTDRDCFFDAIDDVHVMNNNQALCHTSYNAQCQNLGSSFFKMNGGGRSAIYNASLSGNAANSTQYFVKAGPAYSGVSDEVSVFGGHTDRGQCRNPGLLKTEWVGKDKFGFFRFYNVAINRNTTHDSVHVIDAQSFARVTVDNCVFSTGNAPGMWPGSVLLRNGGTSPYVPQVSFVGVTMAAGITSPEQILDTTGTPDGETLATAACGDNIWVTFKDCWQIETGTPARDGVFQTNVGWMAWNPEADPPAWEPEPTPP